MSEIFKSGFVSILGRPNVGKSTIMNRLIGQKIAITSNRAQTTRKQIQTVYTDERGQIIFLDTPGVTKADSKLGQFMEDSVTESFKTSDAVMWIIEPSTFIGAGERVIVELLKKAWCKKILVINKIDTCDPEKVTKTVETYTQELEFDQIVACSAHTGDNMDGLMSAIFDILPEGPMYYDEDTLTEETERDIVAEFIREKCLKFLDKEIPHGIAVVIDKMKDRYTTKGEEITDIEASIICERDSHKSIIIGKGGTMLKKIGSASRHDIEDMLQRKANLQIWVKVRPGWRDNYSNLKEFGYVKKKDK